jgi:NAD(P)-dependent dehydrogenase (short-subunit alcohol dehydrogenase family)
MGRAFAARLDPSGELAIAATSTFLASDDASYVPGHTLPVTGGR